MCIVYSYCGVMMGSFVSMWFDSPRSFFSFVFSSHRSAAALGRGFTSAPAPCRVVARPQNTGIWKGKGSSGV